MLSQQVEFINRERELDVIQTAIQDWGTVHVLCIHGIGGIGKTRLLKEIGLRYVDISLQDKPLLIAETIDFDDYTVQTSGTLQRKLSQLLGEKTFASYLQRAGDWRKMEMAGVSPERLHEESQKVHKSFVECFSQLAAKHRIILRFDSTDAFEKSELWNFLLSLGVELTNMVLIIAGRNAKNFFEDIQPQMGVNAQLIELQPLEWEAREQYLQQKQNLIHEKIDPILAEKLLHLSQGRPIWIDLAMEWKAHDIPFDWLIESKTEDITSLSSEQLQEFESHLVDHIIQIRTDMDKLILAMSHVYPLDEKLIVDLLNVPAKKARELFEEAQTYAFVKTLPEQRISLHDEMRRMVDKYVWPEVDQGGDRLRRDSRVAAKYFEKEVKELEGKIEKLETGPEAVSDVFLNRDALIRMQDPTILQQLKYTFFWDTEEGLSLYEDLMRKTRQIRRIELAEKLERTVQPFISSLSPDQKYRVDIIRGRLLNDLGRPREAEELLDKLLEENRNIPERASDIYNALGMSEIHLGRLDLALQYQSKSLEIAEEQNMKRFIPVLLNVIGYIYRMRGEWTESIQCYRRAINEALRTDATLDTIAGIQNNLGYVLSLDGKYDEAARYGEQAVKIWEKLRTERNVGDEKVGMGETTLGAIYRYRGDYDLALKYHKQSLTRFEEPKDSEQLVRAYFHLGFTQWFKGDEEENLDWYVLARESFEKSLELAEKYFHIKELPRILHEMSHIYWGLEQYDKAREVNDKAYEIGKEVRDIHYAINSLVAKAEFDFDEGQYDDIPSYADILKKEYEDEGYHYPLFYGRMRRILAEIAFAKQEYETSFNYYAEGLSLIMQHGGYGWWLIDKELVMLEQKLLELPPEIAHEWSTKFKEYWGKQEPQEKYGIMVSWCDQQIVEAKLRLES